MSSCDSQNDYDGYICVYCEAENVTFGDKTKNQMCDNCCNDIKNKIKNGSCNLCKKQNIELYYCSEYDYSACDTWNCFNCTYTYDWKSDFVKKNFMCMSCHNREVRNSQV